MKRILRQASGLAIGYIQTAIIIGGFLLIILYSNIGRGEGFHSNLILNVVALSILVDGIFLILHVHRKHVEHGLLSFDAKKLTVVIACYNGEDVIGDTIENALVHVKPEQVIVVSDASTDNTVKTAKSYGVRVVENERNVNKAFSISFVMKHVKTPYVAILDDDTLIGKTFIPTSLLDEGYDAVAFNVMPIETGTLINKIQLFEYRKSMVMGKGLRGAAGAVGNVSGAIGLYKTSDLMEQVDKHSGQFGGEDQQRTAFVHLHGKGKGVTYTDATVLTKAPDTFKQIFKQRSFRWNLSLPELFFVYLRILFNPKFHYLLKTEKAYQIYLLATDPGRILFFGVAFFYPVQTVSLYFFYLLFSFIVWFKIGKKDPIWILFIYPFYSSFESICRFVAHFYWFKIKYKYIFEKQFHTLVPGRKLLLEYVGVFVLIIGLWTFSITKFVTAAGKGYGLAKLITDDPMVAASVSTYHIPVREGDSRNSVARKAIVEYAYSQNVQMTSLTSQIAVASLAAEIQPGENLEEGQIIDIDKRLIEQYVHNAISWQ